MKKTLSGKSIAVSVMFALVTVICILAATAAGGDDFAKGRGMIARIGAGAPSNFNDPLGGGMPRWIS